MKKLDYEQYKKLVWYEWQGKAFIIVFVCIIAYLWYEKDLDSMIYFILGILVYSVVDIYIFYKKTNRSDIN